MLLFFSLAVLFVIVALAILLPGLFKGRRVVTSGRNTRNVAIARERLAEIDSDLAGNVIDQHKYELLRGEIERALVEDLDSETNFREASMGGQWAAVVIAFALPVLASGFYLAIGTPSAVDLNSDIVAPSAQGIPDADDIPGMISALAARLEETPDDAEGWALLGRSYMNTGQYDLAVDAFGRLLELAGEHPLILLMLADAHTMSDGGRVSDTAHDLIQRSMILDPNSAQGLWMSGIAAIQRGQTAEAIGFWEELEPRLADNPQQQAEIAALIRGARELEGDGATVPESGSAPDTGTPAPAVVSVSVDIGEKFRDRVSPDDAVFVFARAATGPPMPLAVKKIAVADLPTDIVLDDNDAMTPAMSLSQFQSIIVGARVSSSGNATAQPGDIQGMSGAIDRTGTVTVNIVMDQIVE